MRSATRYWQWLGSIDGREAIIIAIGCAAPFVVTWFLAAVLWGILGPPAGREGTWRWAWFIPYPYPFTWREGGAVAIMVGLPLGFLTLWALARRFSPPPDVMGES